jgi:hypothetical protein
MDLDGVFADPERGGDLLVAHPLGDELHHFDFARRQSGMVGALIEPGLNVAADWPLSRFLKISAQLDL